MAALGILAAGRGTGSPIGRHSGESGIPPRLDLSGSDNLAGATAALAPRRACLPKAGYLSIGYADELVLPLELTPARRGPAHWGGGGGDLAHGA